MRIIGLLVFVTSLSATRALSQSVGSPPAKGQPVEAYRHRLLGVYDQQSGDPIDEARILDVVSGTWTSTGKAGIASLVFVLDGGSLIRVTKIGYQPQTLFVRIGPSDTTPITLLLEPVAQRLDKVVTVAAGSQYRSPTLRGFEERRRRQSGGSFVDDSILRRMEGQPLSNALRLVSGATVQQGHVLSTRAAGQGPALLNKLPGLTCFSTLYVDGVLEFSGLKGETPPDFDHQTVDQYAGAEFYPGPASLPVWLSPSKAQCGVLLLWTRER